MTEVNSLLALTTAQTVLEVAGNPLVQVPDGYRVQDLEDYFTHASPYAPASCFVVCCELYRLLRPFR
uniref:Uncharacterized protein n=1 Tax=Yersinia enterocolitica W22703 TaxID=913028 RepID=F4N2H0_YEREN|nr:unknown protein [Yersinia enterocolitica W22703]